MTWLAVLILKIWLASASISSVWCICRWQNINAPVIPATLVLILCGAIRVLA